MNDKEIEAILLETVQLSNDESWRYDHDDNDTARFYVWSIQQLINQTLLKELKKYESLYTLVPHPDFIKTLRRGIAELEGGE